MRPGPRPAHRAITHRDHDRGPGNSRTAPHARPDSRGHLTDVVRLTPAFRTSCRSSMYAERPIVGVDTRTAGTGAARLRAEVVDLGPEQVVEKWARRPTHRQIRYKTPES